MTSTLDTTTATIISCPRCPNRWTGLKTAHCTACHQTFTSPSAFDTHRDGSHSQGTRRCIDPATTGLIDAGRAYPCWGWPSDDRNPHSANPSHENLTQALRPETTPKVAQNTAPIAAIGIPAHR